MRTLAILDARNQFSELLAAVEHGEQVTITQHGCPVARIVSATASGHPDQAQRERVSTAMARLRALRHGVSLGATVAETIEDGRV